MCIYQLLNYLFPCFVVQDDEERDVCNYELQPIEEKEESTPLEDEDEDNDEEKELSAEESFDELDDNAKFTIVIKILEMNDLAQISDFAEAMFDIKVNNQSTIQSVSISVLEELYMTLSEESIVNSFDKVRILLNDQYTTTDDIPMLHKRFQVLRNALKGRFGPESDIAIKHKSYGLTKAQFLIRKELTESSLKDKLENRIQVCRKDALEIIRRTAFCDDIYKNIIALQLSTGSRFVEAVRITEFTECEKGENWITVSGLAKQDSRIQSLERPLFGLNCHEVIHLQNKIRYELKDKYPELDDLDNDKFTRALITKVNNRIRSLDIEGVTTSNMLRKLYVTFSYEELEEEKRNTTEFHSHIQNVLGHNKISSAAPYSCIVLKDDTYDKIRTVMDDLNGRGVKITEMILKRDYGFGSKTISAMSDYKKELNENLKLK